MSAAIMVSLFAFVVFSVLFGQSSVSVRNVAFAEGKTLLTIYSDGQKKTVATDAKTIGEALEQNGIKLGNGDVVEPSADTAIDQAFYNANIYRAYPSLIIDGATKTTVMSGYRSARQVVESSDVKLHSEDKVSIDRNDNFVVDGVIGQRIMIDRATPVEVTIGTKTFQMRTWKPTVGEFLSEKGLTLASNDSLNVDLKSAIYKNMNITIGLDNRNLIQEEVINPETQYVDDPSLSFGTKVVRQKGLAGKKISTYQIEFQKGIEVSRKLVNQTVITEPVKQIIARGIATNVSADRSALLAAAGIAQEDYSYVQYIINNENGLWCPTRWQGQKSCPSSYQPLYAGAETNASTGYGMCQATPASKMETAGADWRTNPVTQLKWCNSYAVGRYGSWANAWAAWQSKRWW